MTNLVGMVQGLPVLKATAGFSGIAIVDADPYLGPLFKESYNSTNVFYRQVRNLVFDTTSMPAGAAAIGIHWPTAQATSLQNCVFQLSQVSGNIHQGVFIEDGTYP
jgi:glucan 1,3-beta-glucosidase